MSSEGGGEGGNKIPRIQWRGKLDEKEVARRNRRSVLTRTVGDLREVKDTRKEDVADLNPELLHATRHNALAMIRDMSNEDRVRADAAVDSMTDSLSVAQMMSIIHGANVLTREADPIRYAAIAIKFLQLTEEEDQ